MIALAVSTINLGAMNSLPLGTRQCLKDLATALKNSTVSIIKGIHQRESNALLDGDVRRGRDSFSKDMESSCSHVLCLSFKCSPS